MNIAHQLVKELLIPTIYQQRLPAININIINSLISLNKGWNEITNNEGNIISEDAWVHFSSIVVNSYLGPGVKVYEGCTVRDSIICSNTVIGHCSEVTRSIILENCSVPRFNYVGGSLLGENIRLGGCVSLATRRHDDQEVTLRIKDYLWKTRLIKFGSIIGSNVRIGFATHINPGTVIGMGCLIGPMIDLKKYIPPMSFVSLRQSIRITKMRKIPNIYE